MPTVLMYCYLAHAIYRHHPRKAPNAGQAWLYPATAPLHAIFSQRPCPSSSESDGHKQWSLWRGVYGLMSHVEERREESYQTGTYGPG